MNELTLSGAVDRLAQRKAEDFITEVKSAIANALKDKWRAKVAGGSAYLGEDIKAVLLAYAASLAKPDSYKSPRPTDDLVSQCRATIVNDLLNGLPKLKELALMQVEDTDAGHE
jgi:hypothetical protein